MSEPPWMLVRLGLETYAHHASADEHRLVALDIETRDHYRAFLARVYGFEASVEAAVWAKTEPRAPLLDDRNKAARLYEDLRALGLSSSDVASLARATVQLQSTAQALGWLFVLERHTLLAGLIRRHVQHTLGNVSLRYLAAYGDSPGARFRALGEELCRYAGWCTPRAIVAGAKEAFRAQRLWYEAAPLPGTEVAASAVRPLPSPVEPVDETEPRDSA